MEKNAKEVAKWMLVPETIELRTSLLKNKFEGSYLEGFETLISNLKSVLINRILAQSKKPILKNKNWFDRDCLKAQYKTLLKEKKSAALKESWQRLIAAVKTKIHPFSGISLEDWGNPLTPINQVPIHAWEEYFRELYTDPDYVTKESQISLDQTLTGPVTPGEISESQNTQVKIKWMEKNAKEVAKWMLVPETIELPTSLLKNKFEGSYLEGFETLISNLKSVLINRILAQSKKPILKNKNWFDYCLKAQYKALLKEKKSAALKESWQRLIAAVKTKIHPFSGISLEDWGNPSTPINQVPIHAWEEYFRELYTDPDYVTKESQISLDQTPYWSPVTPGEIS
ncbi:hypothetical protein E2320_001877, partial [Naja naja]